MFKVTPKGVLFLLSYFPGYRIHLYIPATHFFYGVYQQLQFGPKPGQRANAGHAAGRGQERLSGRTAERTERRTNYVKTNDPGPAPESSHLNSFNLLQL